MNRLYRLVWNRSLSMFVPVTELSRSRKKTKRARGTVSGPQSAAEPANRERRPLYPALFGFFTLLFVTTAASATTFLDFTGGLSGWTTGGNVTLSSTTVTVPTGGATFTLTPAAGYDMARINAPNNGGLLAPDATLGLSASSLESFLNNGSGHITNFGLLTKSYAFNVGTYTFAWAYGAQDYQPYNDGAVFTISGNSSQSLISLARNGSSPSDTSGPSPDTLILGSYGATPWLTLSFDIATAGNYQLGFAVYNWNDQQLAPNLYVSGVAGTYSGTPVQVSGGTLPPAGPVVIGGTGGNVGGSVFDTSSSAYAEPTLSFSGGTLQYTADTTTAKDANLTGSGGAIDTNGNNVNYTGVISGGSDFYKQGAGTLVLTNANTYTGATNIDGGTLALTGTGAIAASSEVVNDGTLDISGTSAGASVKTMSGTGTVALGSQKLTLTNAASTFAGNINGAGSLEVASGNLVLSGANGYTGATDIDSGTLALTGTGAIAASSEVVNNGALDISGTSAGASVKTMSGSGTVALGAQKLTITDAASTFAGNINGAGSLAVASGNLVLSGANGYTGATNVDSGTLALTGTGGIAASSEVVNNGALDISGTSAGASVKTMSGSGTVALGTQKLTITDAASTFAGNINGAGSLAVASGNLVLSGANDYTGATNIDSGVLKLTGTGSVAQSAAIVNNALLDISGTTAGASIKTISGTGNVDLGAQTLTISDASGTYAGGFSGAGSVNVATGTIALSGASTNTGGMSVANGAKLIVASDAALGDVAGVLTLNGGTFANSASLTLARDAVISGTSAFETAADTSITANGKLSGSGALLKTGVGSLVLDSDNSGFGQNGQPASIVVNDGSLVVKNALALGNATVTLNSGSLSTTTSLTLDKALSIAPNTSVSTAANTVFTVNAPIVSAGAGNGCFEKDGAGTLVMAGRADIDAGTCVQDGKLYANGQLNSNVTVQSNGILRGTGTINGATFVAGRLAPGNSPGVLQIAGSVTMAAGSTLQEDINGLGTTHGPGSYSRLIVTGAGHEFVATGATLEPNLVNITGTDTYIPYVPKVGDTFRIVTAEGGIVGTFASVTQPVGLETNTRIETYYDVGNSNSIDLVIVPTSYRAYVGGRAGNLNAQSTAAAFDTFTAAKSAGTITSAQDALLYSVSVQPSVALETLATALSGEVHGALVAAAPLANRWLVDSVDRQLSRGVEVNDGTGLWGRHWREPQRLEERLRRIRLRHHAIAGGDRLGCLRERLGPRGRRLHPWQGRRAGGDGVRLHHAEHRVPLRPAECGSRRTGRHRLGRQQRLGNVTPRSARPARHAQHGLRWPRRRALRRDDRAAAGEPLRAGALRPRDPGAHLARWLRRRHRLDRIAVIRRLLEQRHAGDRRPRRWIARSAAHDQAIHVSVQRRSGPGQRVAGAAVIRRDLCGCQHDDLHAGCRPHVRLRAG